MSDRLSDRTEAELERALKTLGPKLPAPPGAGLLDRVESQLTSAEDAGTRRLWRPLAVAALALAIAGIGAVLVWRAFGAPSNLLGSDPTPPLGPSPAPGRDGPGPVWPEVSEGDVAAVQERADAGDPEVQWRTDPAAVASRVIEDTTHLTPDDVSKSRSEENGITYEIVADGRRHSVTVDQFARRGEGGVWSVTRVQSRLEVRVISVLGDGDTVITGSGAPANARVGYSLHRACPPDVEGECGYDLMLRSVAADARGDFRIEDNFGTWTDQPGALAVWIIEEGDAVEFQDITMIWVGTVHDS